MASIDLNVGTSANANDGDTLRAAFIKVRKMFAEVYGQTYVSDTDPITPSTFKIKANKLQMTADAVAGDDGKVLTYDHASGSFTWADAASGGYTASYVTDAVTFWTDKNVYVFANTADLTHTLPASPSVGTSFKMSLRSTFTNTLARNGNSIMGLAEDLVLDDLTAAFELFFAGGAQGWVIIGAN